MNPSRGPVPYCEAMRPYRSLLGLVIAAVLLLGFAAGCGDSDDDEGATTTEASADAPPESNAEDGGGTGDAVTISDFSFEPEDLTVSSGTTVTWTNSEGEPVHTVTSDDGAPADFDSDDVDPGGTFEFTFEEAGEYPYVCKIHASMNGTVTVE
jgi:plastocyanin